MQSALNKNKAALLAVDVIIILFCCAGLYQNYLKATLPFKLTSTQDYLIATEVNDGEKNISRGDLVYSLDNHHFNKWEEIELYLDGKNVGDDIFVEYGTVITKNSRTFSLVNFYTIPELTIILVVSFTFLIMGILLRLKASENRSAITFHWASMVLGMVISMTAGNYSSLPLGIGYLTRVIWLFAYAIVPVLFILFVATFTETKVLHYNKYFTVLYTISVSFGAILSYYFISYVFSGDLIFNKNYIELFNIFRIFIILCIVLAISFTLYISRISDSIEERRKLRWLLLGFFIGPFSFAVFWVLPIIITGHSLLPESLIIIFLIAIPITFAIAIIRYQFMDIDVIMRRSVVYTIILAGILLTYISFSAFISIFVTDLNPAYPSIITAVLVTVMLQPVKTLVQKFVDKKFFRLEYDYREEQKRFLSEIKNKTDIKQLAQLIVSQTDELIPVEKIGFFILKKPENRISLLAHKGFKLLEGRSILFDEKSLKTDLPLPVAVNDKIESGVAVESADLVVFRRWGIVLIHPIKSASGEFHGFLVLGNKKSDARFYQVDIDLLNTISAAAALTIDRIKLQEDLILEKLETYRLDELNRLKSYFVSTVSHDLKTPLTSIRMFAELLQTKKELSLERMNEYLKIIEGESNRLQRLIDNVLDFAKIEKGIKVYNPEKANLCEIAERAAEAMNYQFNMAKIKIEKNICNDNLIANVDVDAIEEAIINLLSNAIKYSKANTTTSISAFKDGNSFVVQVSDEGCGISENDLKNIFEPFFRTLENSSANIRGTGLGLSIVKHIMDAHNGRIKVESELNKGSTFSLIFPTEG